MSGPPVSVAKVEFNFLLQLLKFRCTLLPTMQRKLSSTICLTVRIVHCSVLSLITILHWGSPRTPKTPLATPINACYGLRRVISVHCRSPCLFCILKNTNVTLGVAYDGSAALLHGCGGNAHYPAWHGLRPAGHMAIIGDSHEL